ncbi:uncharacterized protein LOC119481881 isoform X2 [Sebastes umbrosus]|uniref:uncharacterized protein LOC119481881 isoform X2 n=1 Tax=Sebastes umbrosus TaxID=72105 RepID=UPI00189D26AB|nr:uncharacterized protein LOC119481881 isoform X2 [Sebastes umbrosus]
MSRSAAGVSLVVTVTLLCLSVGVIQSTASATQDVFQAEEGSNVTLTCLFHLKTHTPATSLYIDIICENLKRSIYRYDSEFEAEPYEDELYRGRVLCDLELLKKGRIECLFTDLRLNDTSTYVFIVVINEDSHSKRCGLNVTEASHQPVDEPVEPSSRGRIGLYMGGSLFTVMLTTLAVHIGLLHTRCNR